MIAWAAISPPKIHSFVFLDVFMFNCIRRMQVLGNLSFYTTYVLKCLQRGVAFFFHLRGGTFIQLSRAGSVANYGQ
jgi:hypothetical protein